MFFTNLKSVIMSTFILTSIVFGPLLDAGGCGHKEQCCEARQKIAGSYFFCGFDPYLNVKYEGTLVITHLCCNVYTFHWTYVDGHINTGTGIYDKQARVIAANFVNTSDATHTGVEIFRVTDRGIIKGRWVLNGQCQEGKETLVKVRC